MNSILCADKFLTFSPKPDFHVSDTRQPDQVVSQPGQGQTNSANRAAKQTMHLRKPVTGSSEEALPDKARIVSVATAASATDTTDTTATEDTEGQAMAAWHKRANEIGHTRNQGRFAELSGLTCLTWSMLNQTTCQEIT